MVSWSLVGAQGRYRLATTISIICSWFVTLPVSAIFIYVFHFNLEAIAAAIVIGYSTTGMVFAVLLIIFGDTILTVALLNLMRREKVLVAAVAVAAAVVAVLRLLRPMTQIKSSCCFL